MSPRAQAGIGLGSNLANEPPPDLPTEPRTRDVQAWRDGIDARRQQAGGHRRLEVAAVATQAAAAVVCPVLPAPARPASLVVRAPRAAPEDERRAAVVAAYLAGDSTLVLAARYQVCRTTIATWLKAAGVTLRPQGGRRAPIPEPGPGAVVDQPAPQLVPDPPACRLCGCTDERACPSGCTWVGPDLCSACARVTPAVFHPTEVVAPDVADALQDVLDAAHLLIDTTPEAAAAALDHFQGLVTDALLLLGHPTTPPTTGA